MLKLFTIISEVKALLLSLFPILLTSFVNLQIAAKAIKSNDVTVLQ